MSMTQEAFTSRATDPATSVEASAGTRAQIVADVFDCLERAGRGLTADELAQFLPQHLPSTLAGICSRRLVDSGERRLTRRSRPAIVWKLPCEHAWVLGSFSKTCARCDLTALYQSQNGGES